MLDWVLLEFKLSKFRPLRCPPQAPRWPPSTASHVQEAQRQHAPAIFVCPGKQDMLLCLWSPQDAALNVRRDLRAGAPDSQHSLWRAEGNETCAVSLSRPAAAAPASAAASRGPGQAAARAVDSRNPEPGPAALAAWAQGAGCLLRQLRERVCMLLGL